MGAVMIAFPDPSPGVVFLTIGAGSTAATIGMWIDHRLRRLARAKN
jgi:hypothetical protein